MRNRIDLLSANRCSGMFLLHRFRDDCPVSQKKDSLSLSRRFMPGWISEDDKYWQSGWCIPSTFPVTSRSWTLPPACGALSFPDSVQLSLSSSHSTSKLRRRVWSAQWSPKLRVPGSNPGVARLGGLFLLMIWFPHRGSKPSTCTSWGWSVLRLN